MHDLKTLLKAICYPSLLLSKTPEVVVVVVLYDTPRQNKLVPVVLLQSKFSSVTMAYIAISLPVILYSTNRIFYSLR